MKTSKFDQDFRVRSYYVAIDTPYLIDMLRSIDSENVEEVKDCLESILDDPDFYTDKVDSEGNRLLNPLKEQKYFEIQDFYHEFLEQYTDIPSPLELDYVQ